MRSEFAPLLRGPVTVTIHGQHFSLPFRPAAEWAAGLERLDYLVTHLADQETRDAVVDIRLMGAPVREELSREGLRILEEQGGRKWWEVARLIATSMDTRILGKLVLAGVDPWQRSVGEWAAAVYAVCVEGQNQQGLDRFEFTLSIPPPGFEDRWDDEVDLDAIEAEYAALSRK